MLLPYGTAITVLLVFLVVGQPIAERFLPYVEEPSFLLPTVFAFTVASIAALYVSMRLDRRPLRGYGLGSNRVWWRDFGAGVLIGLSLIVLGTVLKRGMGWARISETGAHGDGPFVLALIIFLGLAVAQGTFLEVVFRGITIQNSTEGLTARTVSTGTALFSATLVAAILFTLFQVLHTQTTGDGNFSAVVVSWLLLGGSLGLAFIFTGRLKLPIGLVTGQTATRLVGITETDPVIGVEPPALVGLDTSLPGGIESIDGLTIPPLILGYVVVLGWVRWAHGSLNIDETLTDR